jgi:hypothetical protein
VDVFGWLRLASIRLGEDRLLFSHDEPVDSLHNEGEKIIVFRQKQKIRKTMALAYVVSCKLLLGYAYAIGFCCPG